MRIAATTGWMLVEKAASTTGNRQGFTPWFHSGLIIVPSVELDIGTPRMLKRQDGVRKQPGLPLTERGRATVLLNLAGFRFGAGGWCCRVAG